MVRACTGDRGGARTGSRCHRNDLFRFSLCYREFFIFYFFPQTHTHIRKKRARAHITSNRFSSGRRHVFVVILFFFFTRARARVTLGEIRRRCQRGRRVRLSTGRQAGRTAAVRRIVPVKPSSRVPHRIFPRIRFSFLVCFFFFCPIPFFVSRTGPHRRKSRTRSGFRTGKNSDF